MLEILTLKEMELEARLIGVTAQAADLVPTVRGTVTTTLSAPKTMSVETITASTTGIWQKQKLTAAFRVPNHYEKNNETVLQSWLLILLTLIQNFRGKAGRRIWTS